MKEKEEQNNKNNESADIFGTMIEQKVKDGWKKGTEDSCVLNKETPKKMEKKKVSGRKEESYSESNNGRWLCVFSTKKRK